ncbi:MAG: PQQ-binding-like beta-propeller repeat protein [Planctomycetota bacterium]|nr:PQQ-binding-like beta-propeller repeat protein [Planctomycetota bacterium]
MRIHPLANTIALVVMTLLTLPVSGDDWPQWRGPNRDAKSHETGLLQAWPAGGPPLKWQTDLLGEGYASVVVANARLHTIGNEEGMIFAYGLSEATGEILWKTKIGESSRHAMSTPTIDGDYLYALDPDGELSCLHVVTGEIQWQVDFIKDYGGKLQSGRGYGESPLIDGKYLICTPGAEEAMVVALNKATGELVWKTAAPTIGDKGGDGAAFSSIVKTRIGEIDMYVQLVGRGLIGIECRGGRYLWGYNDICADIVNIPTPVIQDDYVFSANGYNSGSVLLQLKPVSARAIEVHEVYRLAGNQFQNHHGGVVALNGKIFGGHGSNNGLPTCVDFQSGKVLWKRRGPGVGSAAVIYADNRFVFRYQNGVVALLAVDEDGFSIEGKLQISGAGGDSWSHPVIANGALFLREQNALYVHNLKDGGEVKPETTTAIASTFPNEVKSRLKQLGVEHASLGQRHSSTFDVERFYSYMIDSADAKTVNRIPIVTLKPNANGEFSPDIIQTLADVSHEFVVDLAGLHLNQRQIQQLGKLSHMKGLDLQFCTGLSSNVLALVGDLKGLRALRLAGTEVSNESIERIVKLTSLQSLDLELFEYI